MKKENLASERIGEVRKNKFGSLMEIVKYNNTKDIVVRFIENGNLVYTDYKTFRKGEIKNIYDRSVYGIGYVGDGDYKPSIEGKHTKQYKTWVRMLERCYSEKLLKRYPTYKGCTVWENWHNFQNFAKWFDESYYEVDNERMELDKDILLKGNKQYSPENCIFVPKKINLLFIRNETKRGKLPIGVRFNEKTNKYIAYIINNIGKDVILKQYDLAEEAFETYKKHKENYIKEIAERYRNKIPSKLYEVMINYKVEITD